MKTIIAVVFPDLDDKNIRLELDDSLSPKTFQAIIDHLPVKVKINRWGDELYTDPIGIDVEEEENAKTEVNEMDVAYWPEGRALCLFYGPTPISKNEKILAYSFLFSFTSLIRFSSVPTSFHSIHDLDGLF